MNTLSELSELYLRQLIQQNVPVPYLSLPGSGGERSKAVKRLIALDYVKRVRTEDTSTVEWTGKVA